MKRKDPNVYIGIKYEGIRQLVNKFMVEIASKANEWGIVATLFPFEGRVFNTKMAQGKR